MANLLGDLWAGGEPDWAAALAHARTSSCTCTASDATPGRKMGHLTALADSASEAKARVLEARAALKG